MKGNFFRTLVSLVCVQGWFIHRYFAPFSLIYRMDERFFACVSVPNEMPTLQSLPLNIVLARTTYWLQLKHLSKKNMVSNRIILLLAGNVDQRQFCEVVMWVFLSCGLQKHVCELSYAISV